jgi:hypothetical protein
MKNKWELASEAQKDIKILDGIVNPRGNLYLSIGILAALGFLVVVMWKVKHKGRIK